MIKIICCEPQIGSFFVKIGPKNFNVHKTLLCHHSRFFQDKLQIPFDREIMEDAVGYIAFREAQNSMNGEKSTYFCQDDAPAGYVPSWIASFEEWRRQAQETPSLPPMTSPEDTEKQTEEIFELLDEPKHLFSVFVHWLYTKELILDDAGFGTNQEAICVQIYGLAERLDAPALRQQCYNRIHKYYAENHTLPEPLVIELVISECKPTSRLRKYMVSTIAHEVIKKGKESKESCDHILALDKDFAAEVALEIMDRLRSDDSSKDPNTEEEFEADDSDSDVCSSEDLGSEFTYHSDMSISDGEELDSLFNAAPEGSEIAAEGAEIVHSSLTNGLESDQAASDRTTEALSATGSGVQVKVESDSLPDRIPIDLISNKRKRPSSEYADSGNPRSTRSGTANGDDVEIIDLTELKSD